MSKRYKGTIVDILNNEINIGDKVVFVPYSCDAKQEIWFGIVTRYASSTAGVYIKPLSNNCDKEILRYSNQIAKI